MRGAFVPRNAERWRAGAPPLTRPASPADLSAEALGFGVIAFIQVTLATHSPDNAKKFRALVARVDEIQEAYSLTGDADYVLKAVLRDLKGLSEMVNHVLMPHPSVAHVRSSIVLDRLKETTKLPLKKVG